MDLREFQELFFESFRGPLADLLDLRSQAVTSYYMDLCPVQDSFRYRAKHLGLRVAGLVIDPKGELHLGALSELAALMDQTSFVLGPNREGDPLLYAHIRNCLHRLKDEADIWGAIRKFSPPLCHRKAEEIVRDTLWPETISTLQTVHVRKAVLAAWFTLLRQTTGSCFATAPAILIQQRDPIRFFKDLYDLLNLGQMKRTVGGKEYSVPMNVNGGRGDLQRTVPFLFSSPGVVGGLKAAGLGWTASIERRVKEGGAQSPEQLFSSILMEVVGLTAEDVKDEEHLSAIQMAPLLARQTGVYYQKPSARGQKVAEWKKRLGSACRAFESFTECPLLRSWEYTIASLCDVKTEFSRWNLYVGLGMHPDQVGGVGWFLRNFISEKLDQCQHEIDRITKEYEQAAGAVRAIEVMIEGSVSEQRRHQLKAEMTAHIMTANSWAEERNRWIEKGDGLSRFFSSALEQYDQKLQESFQELFDPALIGPESLIYNDSPAGFRLVYKHGRRDASQWTQIRSGEEYVDALRDFFSQVENDLQLPPQMERGTLSEITTALIRHIQEPQFLESALQRAAERGKKSPWDYISGGTMQTLLMAYCNRDKPFTETALVPRSEEELLRFFLNWPGKDPVLIHSPTHAFVFYPELLTHREIFPPPQQKWNEEMQEHIAHRISLKLPEGERALFLHLLRQKGVASSNLLFRNLMIESIGGRMGAKGEVIDGTIFEETPLLTQAEAKGALEQLFHLLNIRGKIELEGQFYGPHALYQIAKEAALKLEGSALTSIDWDLKISEGMRKLRLAPPSITLFADTNWSGWFFGFVVNGATQKLELWRLNRNGMQGFPMSDWKEWTSPNNSSSWVLLSKPDEYMI